LLEVSTMEVIPLILYLQTNCGCDIVMSTIARGIAVGDELEYADEVTLGRSILQRVPFEKHLNE
jgi:recombination protein RecR